MGTEIIIGILAVVGTIVGSGGGILVANKIVNYRLKELEKKVDKHNNLVVRMFGVESDVKLICQRLHDMEGNNG